MESFFTIADINVVNLLFDDITCICYSMSLYSARFIDNRGTSRRTMVEGVKLCEKQQKKDELKL